MQGDVEGQTILVGVNSGRDLREPQQVFYELKSLLAECQHQYSRVVFISFIDIKARASLHAQGCYRCLEQVDVPIDAHLVQERSLLMSVDEVLDLGKLAQTLEVHQELYEVHFRMFSLRCHHAFLNILDELAEESELLEYYKALLTFEQLLVSSD